MEEEEGVGLGSVELVEEAGERGEAPARFNSVFSVSLAMGGRKRSSKA
jgi:hypothetical protein